MTSSEHGASVVIAQTYTSSLKEIEEAIGSSPHQIRYSTPEQVQSKMYWGHGKRPHLFISGSLIPEEARRKLGQASGQGKEAWDKQFDALTFEEQLQAIWWWWDGKSGFEWAQEIQQDHYPSTLALGYSHLLEQEFVEEHFFHGRIPREEGIPSCLVELLQEPELKQIIESREWETLRSRHPGITWYKLRGE